MKVLFIETLKLTFDGKMLACDILKDIEMDADQVKAGHKASVEITEAKNLFL